MHETHITWPLLRRSRSVAITAPLLLGVGFSFVAKQKAGHGCGKLNCSKHFRLPEYNHDPPSCTLSVERNRWQAFSANEQADGRLLGVVEPRHDRSTVMFVDRRRLGLGANLEGKVLHVARTAP